MNIAIVECTTECADAHVRQAKFIKEYLQQKGHNCIILYKNTINDYINKKYDVIIKSYVSYYENHKAEEKLYANNKDNAKFFFLTNEYTIQTGTAFQRSQNKNVLKCDIISNFNNISKSVWKNHFFVNLNALFYQPKQT